MTITLVIDHVQLAVPRQDVAEVRRFYGTLLGLREVRDPSLDRPGTLRYALGALRLDLAESDVVLASPLVHLALAVSGFQALKRRLEEGGVAVREVPLLDRDRLYVEDPFGNALELIEEVAGDAHH